MESSNLFLLLCSLSLFLYNGVKCEDKVHSTHKGDNTNEILTGEERNSKIEMLLKDPKAMFFTGENMTGEIIGYDSTNSTYPSGCQLTYDRIKSMRISQSCVRVFNYPGCNGLSRSIYPKPNSEIFINFLTRKLVSVGSVGPCFPNEFQFASVFSNGTHTTITKDESHSRQLKDLVNASGSEAFLPKAISPNSPNNPISYYYMDQGRPKWIEARIRKENLNSRAGASAGRNSIIPPGLGGPATEAYNTFPQSQSNFEEWKQITDQISSFLYTDPESSNAWVYLTFVYESSSDSDTKPYGFYYHVSFVKIDYEPKNVLNGFIENN